MNNFRILKQRFAFSLSNDSSLGSIEATVERG